MTNVNHTMEHLKVINLSSVCPLNFRQPSKQPGFRFLKWHINAENHKTNNFYCIFKARNFK